MTSELETTAKIMQLLVIVVVYALLMAGECQKESKGPNTTAAVNASCHCGNTHTYTMNVGEAQSSMTSNDDVIKEAVKVVVDELLERKMEAVVNRLDEVVNRLEEKIENSTEQVRVQMKADIKELLSELQLQQNLIPWPYSLSSCKSLPPNSPSGYYWIYNSTGQLNYQFCDMTRKCGCNGTGGWMRVANLDMTNTSQQCPGELRLITSPKRTCGRMTPTIGCASVVFPTNGHQYSQVCGKIKAYQYGQPEAFYTESRDWLADGIGVYTSGQSQHIWTFVVGQDEARNGVRVCPCNVGHPGITINTTIGQDYFCDTGSETLTVPRAQVFYSDDPLWDGAGCGPRSACCSFNNPPWFCKQLPQPTTDDIELQMCGHSPITNEDTPIEIVEIYVQ